MRIAVAGATGTVGRHVVEIARERGHEPVPLSRAEGVDLLDRRALTRALAGAHAVIDVAGVSTTSARVSEEFFRIAGANLLAAGAENGVGHHLALSIVGVDHAPTGYYAGKVVQEQLVEASPLPWTMLRATQFHEFAAQMLGRVNLGPLHLVPLMRTQPLAAREVASRLVELVESPARGRAADLAGPREERLLELARAYARATGLRGPVLGVALPGAFGAALRDGRLLPGPEAQRGTVTFGEWLRTVGAAR